MLGAPEEILPGVRHWAAFQPELGERFSSYNVEPAGGPHRIGEPSNDTDEVAPGVTAIEIGKLASDETALHVAAGEGAIALIRPAGGPLAFGLPGSCAASSSGRSVSPATATR